MTQVLQAPPAADFKTMEANREGCWSLPFAIRRTTGAPKFTDEVFAKLSSDGNGDSLEEYLTDHADRVYIGQLFTVVDESNNFAVTHYKAGWDGQNWVPEELVPVSSGYVPKKRLTVIAGGNSNSTLTGATVDGNGYLKIDGKVKSNRLYVVDYDDTTNSAVTYVQLEAEDDEGIDNTVVLLKIANTSQSAIALNVMQFGDNNNPNTMIAVSPWQSSSHTMTPGNLYWVEFKHSVVEIYDLGAVSVPDYASAAAVNNLI